MRLERFVQQVVSKRVMHKARNSGKATKQDADPIKQMVRDWMREKKKRPAIMDKKVQQDYEYQNWAYQF